jgi:hypothetical protein
LLPHELRHPHTLDPRQLNGTEVNVVDGADAARATRRVHRVECRDEPNDTVGGVGLYRRLVLWEPQVAAAARLAFNAFVAVGGRVPLGHVRHVSLSGVVRIRRGVCALVEVQNARTASAHKVRNGRAGGRVSSDLDTGQRDAV